MRSVLVLAILLVIGCGEKNRSEAPEGAQSTAPSAGSEPVSNPTVKATLVPLPKPNQYEIVLEWEAEGVFAEQWWVQRVKPSTGPRPMVRLPATARRYTITDVAMGVDHEYRLYAHNEGTNAEIGAVALHPFADRVFAEGETIWRPERYGRLFFERGSVLRMPPQQALDIELLELHSEGGTIANDSKPAPAGVAGVSSMAIKLKVGLARGDLQIVTDGQAGGRGLPGAPGATGAGGKDAFAGRWEAWARTDGASGFILRQSATPAERGGRGGDGAQGGAGNPGGEGGAITLLVDDAQGFWPTLSSEGGRGGAGGEGGPPGAGGPGGRGAAAVPGGGREWLGSSDGPSGDSGKPGEPGADGKPGRQELKLGASTFSRY